MKKTVKQGLKRFLLLSSLIFAIAVIFTFVNDKPTFADSGFGTSYSSGGSSSSGGRRSSSSSSSSSSDRDRDRDRESKKERNSSSSGSSSGSGGFTIEGILFALFPILVFILLPAGHRKSKRNQHIDTKQNEYRPSQEELENQIKQYIPNFNRIQFLNEGYKIYCDIQEAWMNFKLEDVKDILTDELYNMYESQLATLEVKGEQNIMKDFVLKKSSLKEVQNQNNTLTITTDYTIEFYDYIANRNTGETIRGNSERKMRVRYEMKFRQSLDQSKVVDKCPSCGAPIKINSFGTCEYCKAKIVTENTKWVLTEKKVLNQYYS